MLYVLLGGIVLYACGAELYRLGMQKGYRLRAMAVRNAEDRTVRAALDEMMGYKEGDEKRGSR